MTVSCLSPRRLVGVPELFTAAGADAYTRMTVTEDVVGYATDEAVAWFTGVPWQPGSVSLRGRAHAAIDLLEWLRAEEPLGPGAPVRLPLLPDAELERLPVHREEDWYFLATERAPRKRRGESDVEVLPSGESERIERLLRDGHPATSAEPRATGIRRWFGIREGERLVACGADRSVNGVGFLVKITVDPAYGGRGLGSALTAAMTRALLAEFGEVALGVTVDNARAIGLYERLGYREVADVSSVRLTG
ncbi:FR47-like protein [Actinopolyspora xinjiangensis]|uniref:FR47-like protein n=1 Tax=Actinopolyspora xinjiangensis TaxID=405564 RepID=A0A1H0UM95_9ACTN|nr:GNAT family N-acetyltransferase [Actinopolyspora xinjiangensis]SDP67281.1 FR47-like protein [Actinopolyspora xinjiangensis]